MTLPIELVPNTNPPLFRWQQIVGTLVGTQTITHESTVPPTLEKALIELINVASNSKSQLKEVKELVEELNRLKKDNEALQALLLSAEDKISQLQRPVNAPPNQGQPIKKGK